jgi:cellulose 1,4-beta-cellobiosidase
VVVTLTRSGSAITSNPGTVTDHRQLVHGRERHVHGRGHTGATDLRGRRTLHRRDDHREPYGFGVAGRVDNPYSGAGVYNNPQWRAAAVAGGGSAIANQPTAVWFDRISAITGNGSATTGSMGLVQHLNEAVTQDTANGSAPMVFQMVIYDLPGRDCAALASNGELGPTELPRYKAEYIDPIAAILARPEYAALRIVAIIEIDSLPNLVTNTTDRVTGTPQCDTMKQNGGYVQGVGYALAKGAVPNVYNYVDAGHQLAGLGHQLRAAVQMMMTAATASGATPANVHGFITNTANTSALQELYITVDSTTRPSAGSTGTSSTMNRPSPGMAQSGRERGLPVDHRHAHRHLAQWLGRCGTSDRTVDSRTSTRIDASTHRPAHPQGQLVQPERRRHRRASRAAPAAGMRPVWIKPPGESDGEHRFRTTRQGFDRMCDPTYGGNGATTTT